MVNNSVSARAQLHGRSCVSNGIQFSAVDFTAYSRTLGVCVVSLLSGPEIPQSSFSCTNTSNDMGLLGYVAGTTGMLILQCSPSSEPSMLRAPLKARSFPAHLTNWIVSVFATVKYAASRNQRGLTSVCFLLSDKRSHPASDH